MNAPAPVALTASFVADATGGRIAAGDPARRFSSVSIDSRQLEAGALFIALRGERFDGHTFAADAVANGAAGLLVSNPIAMGAAAVIVVDDTVIALQNLARAVRRAAGTVVVAVTGSAGKTTTKEIAAELLALKYRVFRNKGNLNNHIGLPLSLIELRTGPDIAVVELGMNHAGEIRTLVEIAEPNVRVWTNVGDAHIGHFGSPEAVAEAKAEVLERADASTLVVANADDPLVMRHVARFGGRRLTFGESSRADVRAIDVVDRGFDGTSALIETPRGSLSIHVRLPGRAHLSNVLAAVAVAVEFDVPLEAIAARVSTFEPVARRGASAIGARDVRVIDDSYNASPAAVRAALAALAATATRGRRVVVLGEMLELGDAAPALHAACGRAAAAAGVDLLVAVGGPVVDHLSEGARSAGMPASHIHRFPDSAAAAAAVPALVRPFDLILVKGSRGSRTDLVADILRQVA